MVEFNELNPGEPEPRSRILRIRNLAADLSVREFLGLFWEENLHPEDVQLSLIVPEDFDLVEGYVGIPESEAVRACQSINKRKWRGKELDAALVPRRE